MHSFIESLLESKRYRVVRAALLVVACVLIALAISMISSTTEQLSRNQQVAAGVVQTEPRADVLVIASYDDSDAATKLQRDGVVDLLERSSVGVDVEYLDVAALSANKNVSTSSAYAAALSGSDWGSALAKKLRDHGEYAAIVCIDDDALYYVESLHDSLFPKTPVVFVGVNDVSHAQHAFELGYATGLMERCDAAGMVEVASKMNPEATHMLVITDNTAAGLGVRAQFEEAASQSDGGAANEESVVFAGLPVDYVNASTLSRADLGTKISAADDSTLVVYLGAAADASGNAYRTAQTAYYVSQAATRSALAAWARASRRRTSWTTSKLASGRARSWSWCSMAPAHPISRSRPSRAAARCSIRTRSPSMAFLLGRCLRAPRCSTRAAFPSTRSALSSGR